ncbi:MAG: hypothetical protein ACJ713_13305 [Candidatus Sulfotelmatobacter sp.]
MRFGWFLFLVSLGAVSTTCSSEAKRNYDVQAAPEFLFQRKPTEFGCVDRIAGQAKPSGRGGKTLLLAANQPPYLLTRSEESTLRRSEFPSLTITGDPYNFISVVGGSRTEWTIRFCAEGGGQTEAEARERLQQISMTRLGATVSVNSPPLGESGHRRGSLVLDAPADAPVVIYASYSAVQVRDIAASVRITAAHARATILDTTGRVDASAFVVDFAGSRGIVNLSADAEINLKMLSPRFDGTLLAWAQRPVRVLVPAGFVTPFQALVNRRQDFVCRADFCSKITQEKKGGLYVFTYAGDGSRAPEQFHLRSEDSTVVVDTSTETRPVS